ncbi:MAG: phage virion morphogenesis protein [Azoarcus sp.]|jgi:phage virion morphogenesis protein|nr:phage virion morphogenesis protein [Azoarcus sp.]
MMADDIGGIERINAALDGLIAALSPAGRRKIGLRLAQLARRANQRRIAANITPDGAAFAPRLRQKGKNPKRGKMFKKLRAARHLRIMSGASEITITFRGQTGRVAAVHHFGLRDKVLKNLPHEVKYAARPLLGFSPGDMAAMENLLYEHVANGVT